MLKRKHLKEHLATKQVNWQQISNMIGYKEYQRDAEPVGSKDGILYSVKDYMGKDEQI